AAFCCDAECFNWFVILSLGASPMRRRDFIALLAVQRRLGRSPRASSSPASCQSSGSWARARLQPKAHWLPLLYGGCANSAGSRVAPSGLGIGGGGGGRSVLPEARAGSSGSQAAGLSTP